MTRAVGGRWAAAALAAGGLLVMAGCSSSPTPQPSPLPSTPKPPPTVPAAGTIDGTAEPCGPLGVITGHVITVHIQDASGRVVAQRRVGKPWTFTFVISAGAYAVTAPAEHDRPVPVRVSPGASTHVYLLSSCK
jgi:hypothetical protein